MEYLTPDETYWSCDIEADNLRALAKVIWCVCVENIQTDERRAFLSAEEFNEWLEAEDRVLIGHNFLAFDAPVLNRIWGTRIPASQVIDTFVLSQMYSANLIGGHGLDDWGVRLGYAKGEFNDFSRFTPEMLTYCIRDVALTKMVYLALCKRMKQEGFSERGVELEHMAWHIIQNKQKQNGFPFDQEKADVLYAELRAREAELKEEVYRLWPPVLQHVRTFKQSRKSDGTRTKGYLGHLGQYPKLEDNPDGSYNAYDYVEFDLGSPQQRIQKLLDLGWEPTRVTKKGNPKIDEEEMLAFAEESGIYEVGVLARWCVTNVQANMIRTWMNAVNPETGNIHGSLFLASTGRYKHSKPNTANIPGVRHDSDDQILFGEAGNWAFECRSLWTAGGDDWDLVGIDAKGIQLRVLANYLNHPDFTHAVLSQDPHAANQKAMGLPSRALTKTITYAAIMGSGLKLLASTAKVSLSDAKTYKDMFFEGFGLDKLIAKLQDELQRTGRITLCDGTRILVPSDHMVIPYLLQGDESRLMKQAMIFTDQEVRRAGLSRDVLKVGDIHDEWQTRTRKKYTQKFIDLALPCFLRAGESFDYNVPIEGDANIGRHWAQTH